jgi:hypothetical protein
LFFSTGSQPIVLFFLETANRRQQNDKVLSILSLIGVCPIGINKGQHS